MLDRIQDPGNFGTLLRSALAFGFDTIVYEDSVDPFNSKVLRSTQGAIFRLNLIEAKLADFIDGHPDYQYYGTALKNAVSLTTIPRQDKKIAVILGNEGSGVRPEILSKTAADIFIDIEQVESLNVAIAGSIIMHHLRRLEP
jgi:TrmH family RNA methyltransferase